MASFSFGAGNVRKLTRLPLYAAGRIATAVIPRSRDRWVFGCGAGIGDGALALWSEAAAHGHSAVWLTGSDADADEAAALGIRTVPKHSLAGFWSTARARVVVVTHGFGDVNRYAVTGAWMVQLWHGIPLKRIGLDSPETTRSAVLSDSRVVRGVLRSMFRRAARGIRLLPAASHVVRGRLESAFALDDAAVPVTGEPRVDVLSRGSASDRRSAARSRLGAAASLTDARRVVLYAPTWRDGDPDPAIPSPADWRAVGEVLERHDAVLLVRSHPLGEGEYHPPGGDTRVRMLGSDVVRDVTPLLPGVDVLITDYSSLVFDSALVPVPVVFLAPDLETYGRRRGFYGRYGDVAGASPARTWVDAVAQLDLVLGDESERRVRADRARELSDRVHAFRDGGNTRRVYDAVVRGAGLAPTLSPPIQEVTA